MEWIRNLLAHWKQIILTTVSIDLYVPSSMTVQGVVASAMESIAISLLTGWIIIIAVICALIYYFFGASPYALAAIVLILIANIYFIGISIMFYLVKYYLGIQTSDKQDLPKTETQRVGSLTPITDTIYVCG